MATAPQGSEVLPGKQAATESEAPQSKHKGFACCCVFRSNRNIRQVPIPTATEPEREKQDPPESEKEHIGDVDVPEQQSLASSGVFLSCR